MLFTQILRKILHDNTRYQFQNFNLNLQIGVNDSPLFFTKNLMNLKWLFNSIELQDRIIVRGGYIEPRI